MKEAMMLLLGIHIHKKKSKSPPMMDIRR